MAESRFERNHRSAQRFGNRLSAQNHTTCCFAFGYNEFVPRTASRSKRNRGAIRSGSRLTCRFGRLQTNQLFWSAATCQTCRRYGPGVRTKAATSRRTPYGTRYLCVFCHETTIAVPYPPLDQRLNLWLGQSRRALSQGPGPKSKCWLAARFFAGLAGGLCFTSGLLNPSCMHPLMSGPALVSQLSARPSLCRVSMFPRGLRFPVFMRESRGIDGPTRDRNQGTSKVF